MLLRFGSCPPYRSRIELNIWSGSVSDSLSNDSDDSRLKCLDDEQKERLLLTDHKTG